MASLRRMAAFIGLPDLNVNHVGHKEDEGTELLPLNYLRDHPYYFNFQKTVSGSANENICIKNLELILSSSKVESSLGNRKVKQFLISIITILNFPFSPIACSISPLVTRYQVIFSFNAE